MPHSQNGKELSTKQKHRRSGSHYSKGKPEKPKQISNTAEGSLPPVTSPVTPNLKPPAERLRPWSPWLPGDDGRWFYQGRLKADGSGWEYQFTEGYPPAPRRRDPSSATTSYTAPSQALPYGSPPVAAAVSGVPGNHPPPLEPADEDTENSDDDELPEDAIETYPQVLTIAVPQQSQAVMLANSSRPPATAKSGNGSGRQAVAKHNPGKPGKKLSAIVKADKERRISSRKRIKSWLSEVTP